MSSMIQICQNNLGFSLYTVPFVCHMVTTLDEWMKSEMKVSADIGVSLLNTRDQV